MSDHKALPRWVWLVLIILLIGLDQLTKLSVEANFQFGEIREVIPGFFNLTLLYNTGAAFSFLAEAGGWQLYFFSFLAIVVSAWLGKSIWSGHDTTLCDMAYSLIISGALGNVIDRWQHGHVIDFIQFYYKTWYYPAFNIADICICVGVVLMLWDSFFGSARRKEK